MAVALVMLWIAEEEMWFSAPLVLCSKLSNNEHTC